MTTTVHESHDDYEPDSPELSQLYDDFKREHLTPLWTQIDDLMPMHPAPKALPHVWRWDTLYPLAARSGELVAVGRGAADLQDHDLMPVMPGDVVAGVPGEQAGIGRGGLRCPARAGSGLRGGGILGGRGLGAGRLRRMNGGRGRRLPGRRGGPPRQGVRLLAQEDHV